MEKQQLSTIYGTMRNKTINRFSQAQSIEITMYHPNDMFRIDIKLIDYKRGEMPDWDIIRECARILKRYTDYYDTVTTCVLTYNGIFAGEVLYRVRQNKFVWYSKNNVHGKEVYNV